MKICVYLRVSTGRQEASGLGIEAQREAVARYARQSGAEILSEFVETESGSVNARPELAVALALCKKKKAVLLIARLDRLSRSLSFVAQLLDGGVDFRCADMPEANRMTLQMLAVFAEHERTVIRERTKAALAAAKARGVKLGTNGVNLAAANRAEATAFANGVRPHLQAARSAGCSSTREIGRHLTAQGVPTAAGGAWHPTTVARLLKHLERAATQP
jgi:DNA invertase Pin-like site-specific DNA recombinase